MIAQDLTVTPLFGIVTDNELKIKINELVDAHNLFVRQSFLSPDTVLSLPTIVGKPLTDEQILGIVNIMAYWKKDCRCVNPLPVPKGPISICKDCNRPIQPKL